MESKDLRNAWVCMSSECGYIYIPSRGDKSQHIPPGTPFEALPDTWVCPNCGNKKENFKKLKEITED